MVAPTVALTAAPLMPTKSCGSAAGSRTFQKVRSAPAPVERQKRDNSRLSEVKARMPLSRMGKKQTMKTMITLGIGPKPNQVTQSGAEAIWGTLSRETAGG